MKGGFTLIEMAVVLLIIGILAGIVLRNIGGQAIQARDAKRVADLRTIVSYLAQYLAKQGQFPTSSDSSDKNWSNLNKTFSDAGISTYIPVPPSGEPYEYFPCSDDSVTNHFILRTKLEQTQTQAPRVYEGAYYGSSTPQGWKCQTSAGASSTTGVNCNPSEKYYCTIQ